MNRFVECHLCSGTGSDLGAAAVSRADPVPAPMVTLVWQGTLRLHTCPRVLYVFQRSSIAFWEGRWQGGGNLNLFCLSWKKTTAGGFRAGTLMPWCLSWLFPAAPSFRLQWLSHPSQHLAPPWPLRPLAPFLPALEKSRSAHPQKKARAFYKTK